jgi:hypothetical protein
VEAEEVAVGGYTWIAVEIVCLLLDSRLVDPGHWQILTSLLSISLWITGHFAYKQPLKEKLNFLRNGINK